LYSEQCRNTTGLAGFYLGLCIKGHELRFASFTQRNRIKQLLSANVINQETPTDDFVSRQISNPVHLLFPGLLRVSHRLHLLGSCGLFLLATGDGNTPSSLNKSL